MEQYEIIQEDNEQLVYQDILQQLKKKNQHLQQQQAEHQLHITKLENEIQHCFRSQSHEQIFDEFYEHYQSIEFQLPREMKDISKYEIWEKCCNLYQISFFKCREAIHRVLNASLFSITELSKEENENGKVDFDRLKTSREVKTAYQYLLKHCSTKLDKTPVIEEIIASLPADDKMSPILREQAKQAVDICWKMQTVSPPMFLCQPQKFDEQWHKIHAKSWSDPPGDLMYYRPVLMYSAGGIVANKGLVGCKPGKVLPPPNVPIKSNKPQPNNKNCGGCNRKLHDPENAEEYKGKLWHQLCKPEMETCSTCRRKVESKEACQKKFHYYHFDCFICAQCHKNILSDDSKASSDGSTLWCNECASKCYYCQNAFKGNDRHWHDGKHACKVCCHLFLTQQMCFGCKKSLVDDPEKVETNRGVFHKRCII